MTAAKRKRERVAGLSRVRKVRAAGDPAILMRMTIFLIAQRGGGRSAA
jgi:hypothetical protein